MVGAMSPSDQLATLILDVLHVLFVYAPIAGVALYLVLRTADHIRDAHFERKCKREAERQGRFYYISPDDQEREVRRAIEANNALIERHPASPE
jgi:hypothetical protein